MIYNKDVSHCSGEGCPLTHKCYRNYLHHRFVQGKDGSIASYINAKYDSKKKYCLFLIPLKDKNYERSDKERSRIIKSVK